MKSGYFRASAVDSLIDHAVGDFRKNISAINLYDHDIALMDTSPLCTSLKSIAAKFAFGNSEVLKAEAEGSKAITFLMDCFWSAISNRSSSEIDSKRVGANDRFLFSLISPNYIDATKDNDSRNSNTKLSERYRELRLLTDMISGMTDTFCLELAEKLKPLY